MNSMKVIVGGLFFFSLFEFPGIAHAADEKGCATKACHPKVFNKGPILHGPVRANQCTVCHKPKGEIPAGKHRKNAFTVDRTSKPCFACHKEVTQSLRSGGVHKPVREKSCVACHEVHSGKQKSLLRAATPAELCAQCHKPSKTKKKYTHGPIAAGACTFCHSPHSSEKKPLLKISGKDLCFECHDAERFKAKFKHKALEKGCSSCHTAHGSDHKYFIKKNSTELCGDCHQKIMNVAKTAKVKHAAISKAGCAGCHDPHGSKFPKLMKDHSVKVCTKCHTKVISGKHMHGPLEEGDCGACHRPHGGPHARLLDQPFPVQFYGRFTESRYGLCFECHESDITKDEMTKTLTQFRHGELNLHYLHVVAPGNKRNKGRSCKACHEVHAGPQEKQIRASVPFGKGGWSLPVTYTKMKYGGRCVVGCHVPMTYNRRGKASDYLKDNSSSESPHIPGVWGIKKKK
jgi:predicted CXXCH cytochrome family protein